MSNSNFKMADRILSILLAFIMIVSLMPMTVLQVQKLIRANLLLLLRMKVTNQSLMQEFFMKSLWIVNQGQRKSFYN